MIFIKLTIVEDTGSHENGEQNIWVNRNQIVSLENSEIRAGSYHGRKTIKCVAIKTTNGRIHVKETIEYIIGTK